jgi:hypothetical protein
MYIRFTTTCIDSDSRQPQGLFYATGELEDSGDLDDAIYAQLRKELEWFNTNLPKPRCNRITARATFWFQAEAHAYIKRMWRLVHIVSSHGYWVQIHKCSRLRNIVYEDDYQVAAFPHRLDGRRIVR